MHWTAINRIVESNYLTAHIVSFLIRKEGRGVCNLSFFKYFWMNDLTDLTAFIYRLVSSREISWNFSLEALEFERYGGASFCFFGNNFFGMPAEVTQEFLFWEKGEGGFEITFRFLGITTVLLSSLSPW